MNKLYETPKDQDLIYDIGMHKGEDTEFYLRKGFRVVAFEADPELVELCRNRLKEFILQNRLTIVAGAIINPDTIEKGQTKVQFYKNNNISVWGTVCSNWAERNVRLGTSNSIIEVEAINFVSILQQYGMPHYMKIDIEGLDLVCVNALKLFQERPDYISLESNKTSFASIKQEINTLVSLGYNSFQAIEQSGIPKTQTSKYSPQEGNYIAWQFEDGASGLFGIELKGKWCSSPQILYKYRFIRLGYYLLGDDGILKQRVFWRLLPSLFHLLRSLTKRNVPGWYDTHARLASVDEHKL